MKLMLLFVIVIYLFDWVHASHADRQLLTKVTALTFYNDRKTTGRRTSPVDQLQCVGGSARGAYQYYPAVVQCHNKGDDGYNVEWECKADLDDDVKFGKVNVNCEGYDSPYDPYILKGSCSLEYNLEYTHKGANHQSHSYSYSNNYDNSGSGWVSFITFVVMVFIFFAILRACCNSVPAYSATTGGYGGPGYGGPGYGGPGDGPGYAPSSGTGFGGGGFWTGLATGGLLSRLFSRPGGYTFTRPGGWGMPTGGSSGFFGSSRSSGGSSRSNGGSSRTSSGFGGTTRR